MYFEKRLFYYIPPLSHIDETTIGNNTSYTIVYLYKPGDPMRRPPRPTFHVKKQKKNFFKNTYKNCDSLGHLLTLD